MVFLIAILVLVIGGILMRVLKTAGVHVSLGTFLYYIIFWVVGTVCVFALSSESKQPINLLIAIPCVILIPIILKEIIWRFVKWAIGGWFAPKKK